MAEHTPGPWCVTRSDWGQPQFISASGDTPLVALCGYVSEKTTVSSNSRLIAAAPEMLEALTASNRTLIAERDVIYDSITNSAGEITDPAEGKGLAEYNALIDATAPPSPRRRERAHDRHEAS